MTEHDRHFYIMSMKVLLFYLLLVRISVFSIKVIQNRDDVVAKDNSTAEIMNSAINQLDQVTICGRFRSPYLPGMNNSYQNIIYVEPIWFLYSLDLRNVQVKRWIFITQLNFGFVIHD